MQKFYLLAVTLLFCITAYCQTDTLSKADKALLDSMMANDEFLKMLGEKEKNSFDVSVGIGNGAFSIYNNASNATGLSKQLIYTPSLTYRLKSGFSFGVTGYVTNDKSNRLELYQTAVTAAYDYYGKKVQTGVSYTRFLSDQRKYNTKSLYQNDLYGYIKKAKGIIQPGIALGFSNGSYKLAEYVSYKRTRRLLNPLRDTVITISGIDTTDNKASYFSASVNASHDFSFYNVFDKDDELDFSPAFIVNFGSDKLVQTHTNKIFDNPLLSSRKRVEATNKFELQSLGLSIDFTYGIGKFFLQPSIYLDYYLPETTAGRVTAIYSVATGFSF